MAVGEKEAIDELARTHPKFRAFANEIDGCMQLFERSREWSDYVSALSKLIKVAAIPRHNEHHPAATSRGRQNSWFLDLFRALGPRPPLLFSPHLSHQAAFGRCIWEVLPSPRSRDILHDEMSGNATRKHRMPF